jgi:hypothetical protein
VFPDKTDHMIENRLRHDLRAATLAVEHRDRDAPETLAGDAPVRPVLDHPVDPVPPPGGDPCHAVDGLKRLFPEVVLFHRDEPLFRRAEDDRLFAAPAVGIGVLHFHLPEQGAFLPQRPVDRFVRVEDELPGETLDIGRKFPVVVHRGIVIQAALHPDLVVLLAVARSDMDAAAPGVQRDERGEDQEAFPVDQRMAALEPLHDGAGELVEDLIRLVPKAECIEAIIEQILREDEDLALHLHRHVDEVLVERDSQVRGNRPGGRRPDDDGDLLAGKLRQPRRQI